MMSVISEQEFIRCRDAALILADCENLSDFAVVVMDAVRRVIPYENGAFFPVDAATGTFGRPLSIDLADGLFDEYDTHYQNHDIYRNRVFSLAPVPRVDRCSDHMEFARWARNEHRHDFLLANKMHYLAGIQLFHNDKLSGAISIHRSGRSGDFTDSEMLMLDMLASYAQLSYVGLVKREAASRLRDELDDTAQAICLMDDKLHCVYENGSARQIRALQGPGFWGKIRGICRDYQEMVNLNGDRLLVFNGLFRSGSATIRYSLSYMPGIHRGTRFMVCYDLVSRGAGGGDWGRAFSARERDILELLIEGKSNREIGERLFISAETVKSHIKRLFYKTGTQSRAGLVSMALQMREPRGFYG